MLSKIKRGMEKWGHYFLALLCAAVILISALWTREQQTEERNQAALGDQSQRLAEVMPTAAPMAWVKPVQGEVMQAYSEAPVYFSETGIWKSHPAVDFAAEAGETVEAMAAGTVTVCGNTLRIDHGNGFVSVYQGLDLAFVTVGQRVRAGERIGTAGDGVRYEGSGHICVMLLFQGNPAEFGNEWVDRLSK